MDITSTSAAYAARHEITQSKPSDTSHGASQNKALFEAAQKLEVSFLAQLLQYSGFAEGMTTNIGGTNTGQGASAFSSIYINDVAEKIVAGGGIGLADTFYQNLLTQGADHADDQ